MKGGQGDRRTGAQGYGRTGAQGTGKQAGWITAWSAGAVLLSAGYLSSCNQVAAPLRPAGYGYTLVVSDVVATTDTIDGVIYTAGDTITDTVDFKWPASSLPLQIWVQDTANLRADMTTAIELWKHEMIYGEFNATETSDSATADIIVRMMVPPPPAAPRAARRLDAFVGACEGGTDVFVSVPDHKRLWVPVRIYVFPNFTLDDPLTAPCLARVTAHELGHALGLFQHSPDPNDLMYGFPTVDAPSEADVATVLWLYHQPTKLRPVAARDSLTAAPQAAP